VTKPESCRIVYKEASGFQPEPEERRENTSNTITQLQLLQFYRIQSAALPTVKHSGGMPPVGAELIVDH